MNIAKKYQPVFTTNKQLILMWSGRDSGKSKAMAQKIVVEATSNRELDIIVTRANYNSLKGSLFNEILTVISEEGLDAMFVSKTFPLYIKCTLTNCNIYFMGVGGSDLSRTKGFKPEHKLSLVVIDETQQLPDQSNLDQALASFRRHLYGDKGQILLAFNPEPSNSHWMNEFRRMRERDKDWLVLYSSYLDIAEFLTDLDLRQIELERVLNEQYYRYLYLGETNGIFGSVYYTFDRNKHLISEDKLFDLIKTYRPYALVIGIDGATTKDATAYVPILILGNGQGIILDYFFHNPQKNGSMSNEQLFPYVKLWLKNLEKKYDLNGMRDFKNQVKHKFMSIDPAGNSDLRAHLAWNINQLGNYNIIPFTKKNIVRNAQVVQNAFSRNALLMVNTGGFHNYINNRWIDEDIGVTQLESVIWNETGKKFDDDVPNDWTDALTYGVNLYYKNPENLYLPNQKEFYELKK